MRCLQYLLRDKINLRSEYLLESELADRMFTCVQPFRHRITTFNFIRQNIELVIRIMETSMCNFLYKDYIELICCVDISFPLELIDLIAGIILSM